MQNKSLRNSFNSLGVFGIILLLNVAILAVSTIMIIRLESTIGHINSISYDKNLLMEINFYLLEQEISEKYSIMTDDSYFVDSFQESSDEIMLLIEEMQELEESDELTLSPKTVLGLLELQNEFIENFQSVLLSLQEQDDDISLLQQNSERIRMKMHEILDDQLVTTQRELNVAVDRHDERVQHALLICVLCLITLPLLAIWAFFHTSQLIKPFLSLTNSVTAIAGDQFRSELLDNLNERKDHLGDFARALDRLGAMVKQHQHILERKIDEKREHLHEVRRRGLFLPAIKPDHKIED